MAPKFTATSGHDGAAVGDPCLQRGQCDDITCSESGR